MALRHAAVITVLFVANISPRIKGGMTSQREADWAERVVPEGQHQVPASLRKYSDLETVSTQFWNGASA
jgi:hypothetical protein